ncbi:hypothetical protein, variant [Saprolegnia diclina VS20]|uniref:Uncharacterized protein n=1 Tax=Saprolegnia diclina (strain VS20) TaxID=1156394 RepID=T0RE61_SAPDV|nr:hypothetical protein, variant [Saprolegnia diclina VS20]EQC30563.1 hypothetical protein, variant [Saprolegnia diclina VS20]|eukprot:XP_008615889.1 hypothetical protein, variant [Saprolegnia diclina VS20]
MFCLPLGTNDRYRQVVPPKSKTPKMTMPDNDDNDAILRDVFYAYANAPGGRMTNAGFRRMAHDAPNLLTPWFTTVDVDLVYAQASGPLRSHLDVLSFVEALVLLAWRKFPEETQQEALRRLLHEAIFLLTSAPKSAHARAATFASRRLALSANYEVASHLSTNQDDVDAFESCPTLPCLHSIDEAPRELAHDDSWVVRERKEWGHHVAARLIGRLATRHARDARLADEREAFQHWHRTTQLDVSRSNMLRRLFTRRQYTHGRLLSALSAWKKVVAHEQARQRSRIRRLAALRRMEYRRLRRLWTRWRAAHAEQRHLWRVLTCLGHRMHRAWKAESFHLWHQMALHHRAQLVCRRAARLAFDLMHRRIRYLRCGWRRWQDAVRRHVLLASIVHTTHRRRRHAACHILYRFWLDKAYCQHRLQCADSALRASKQRLGLRLWHLRARQCTDILAWHHARQTHAQEHVWRTWLDILRKKEARREQRRRAHDVDTRRLYKIAFHHWRLALRKQSQMRMQRLQWQLALSSVGAHIKRARRQETTQAFCKWRNDTNAMKYQKRHTRSEKLRSIFARAYDQSVRPQLSAAFQLWCLAHASQSSRVVRAWRSSRQRTALQHLSRWLARRQERVVRRRWSVWRLHQPQWATRALARCLRTHRRRFVQMAWTCWRRRLYQQRHLDAIEDRRSLALRRSVWTRWTSAVDIGQKQRQLDAISVLHRAQQLRHCLLIRVKQMRTMRFRHWRNTVLANELTQLRAKVRVLRLRRYSGIWTKYRQAQGFRTWRVFACAQREHLVGVAHRIAALALWHTLVARRATYRKVQFGFMTWRRHSDAWHRATLASLHNQLSANRRLRLTNAWQQWTSMRLRQSLFKTTRARAIAGLSAVLRARARQMTQFAWHQWNNETRYRTCLHRIVARRRRSVQRHVLLHWRVRSRFVVPLYRATARRVLLGMNRWQMRRAWRHWQGSLPHVWKVRCDLATGRNYYENGWTGLVQWQSPYPAPPVDPAYMNGCTLLLRWASRQPRRRQLRAWLHWRTVVANINQRVFLRTFYHWRTTTVMKRALVEMEQHVQQSRHRVIAVSASFCTQLRTWYAWKQQRRCNEAAHQRLRRSVASTNTRILIRALLTWKAALRLARTEGSQRVSSYRHRLLSVAAARMASWAQVQLARRWWQWQAHTQHLRELETRLVLRHKGAMMRSSLRAWRQHAVACRQRTVFLQSRQTNHVDRTFRDWRLRHRARLLARTGSAALVTTLSRCVVRTAWRQWRTRVGQCHVLSKLLVHHARRRLRNGYWHWRVFSTVAKSHATRDLSRVWQQWKRRHERTGRVRWHWRLAAAMLARYLLRMRWFTWRRATQLRRACSKLWRHRSRQQQGLALRFWQQRQIILQTLHEVLRRGVHRVASARLRRGLAMWALWVVHARGTQLMQHHLRGFAKAQQHAHRVLRQHERRFQYAKLALGLQHLATHHRRLTEAAMRWWQQWHVACAIRLHDLRRRQLSRFLQRSWRCWQQLVTSAVECHRRLAWHLADRAFQQQRQRFARWRHWASTRRRRQNAFFARHRTTILRTGFVSWRTWLRRCLYDVLTLRTTFALWQRWMLTRHYRALQNQNTTYFVKHRALQTWRRQVQRQLQRRRIGICRLSHFALRFLLRAWQIACRRRRPSRLQRPRRLLSHPVYIAFASSRARPRASRKLLALLTLRARRSLVTSWARWQRHALHAQLWDAVTHRDATSTAYWLLAAFARWRRFLLYRRQQRHDRCNRVFRPWVRLVRERRLRHRLVTWHTRRNAINASASWVTLVFHLWRHSANVHRVARHRVRIQRAIASASVNLGARKLVWCIAKREVRHIVSRFAHWTFATSYRHHLHPPRLHSSAPLAQRLALIRHMLRCGKVALCDAQFPHVLSEGRHASLRRF